MSSGAIDPIAQTKRVFFRPVDSTDVLKPGDSVCYNWDSVTDHKERTADPVHLGLTQDTYAEGEQEFTGRLFIVEKPDLDNLQNYAGVVKSLGPKAGADGDMIEIFVPNGAMVPVNAGVYCYAGVTILAVQSGSYSLETPVYGTESATVAIAQETIDRSTDGLVWARLLGVNYFENGSYNVPLRTGDGIASGTVKVFERDISTRQTGGRIQATSFRTRLKGSGSACPYGGALVGEVYVEGTNDAPLEGINVAHFNLVLDPGCTVPQMLSAVYARIVETADYGCDKSSATVTPLICEVAMDDENAATEVCQMLFMSNGNDHPDHFFKAQTADAIKFSTADVSDTTCDAHIKIDVAGVDYWIMCKDAV